MNAAYTSIEDCSELLTYINNSAVDFLNYRSGSKSDLEKLELLKPLLAKADKEIQNACAVSETSELCIFIQQFKELNNGPFIVST